MFVSDGSTCRVDVEVLSLMCPLLMTRWVGYGNITRDFPCLEGERKGGRRDA
jgi:hypothetical protein